MNQQNKQRRTIKSKSNQNLKIKILKLENFKTLKL